MMPKTPPGILHEFGFLMLKVVTDNVGNTNRIIILLFHNKGTGSR